MKFSNPFKRLTRFELILWLSSLAVVSLSYVLSPSCDYLTLATSLIGITGLIFISKGMVFGQVLIVVFALLYGAISYAFAYYGEMLTYIFMSAPAAIASIIAWIRNPYGNTDEVKISRLTKKSLLISLFLTIAVTVAFYFILKALNTANLFFSTLSVLTSFFASALTFLRSPYYALAYSANDIVLIVLWVLAAIEDISYFPMIFCFIMFLLNDLYGFVNWKRMKRAQES